MRPLVARAYLLGVTSAGPPIVNRPMTSHDPLAGGWSAGAPPEAPGTWAGAPHYAATPLLVEPLPARWAAQILLVSVLGGVVAQLLFVAQRPGINLLLWVALALLATWRLRRPAARLDRADLWLVPAALSFAAFVALRDDIALRVFDIPAAGALTLAAAVALGGHAVSRQGHAALAWLAGAAVALAVTGAVRLGAGFSPLAARLAREARSVRVARGLLVATPLVLVFAALFAAADAVFAAHLEAAFGLDLDVGDLLYRALFAAAVAWLFAGTLVCAWLTARAADSTQAGTFRPVYRPLGTIEATVVLFALVFVFGFFVLVQAAYLLGGLDTLTVSGLTYSEYARRGFFELMVAALLAGGVLLAIDRLVAQRKWVYRALAVALTALTGVVLISAVYRLGLYQQAYGWTELRFYALAAIVWLGLGIVATAGTLLIDRASVVPRVLLGAALAVALVVNLVGPQAFVTAQNLQRAIDPSLVPVGGRSGVDFHYLGYLGDDSIPVLVNALPQLTETDRRDAEYLLRERAALLALEARDLGWPSWNLARQRAIEALMASGYLVAGE